MSHYFQDDPNLKSNIRLIKMNIFDKEYNFYTDDGIFSKNELDDGTLTLLQAVVKEKIAGRCLDLGCANGVVGIVLKDCFPHTHFDLVDVNQRALSLAKKNVENYQLDDVDVFYSDGFSNNPHHYQFIFFNPPIRAGKALIYQLYEQAYQHLEQQGALYIVIRKSHGALSSKEKLMQLFGNCVIIKRNKGFYVLKTIK